MPYGEVALVSNKFPNQMMSKQLSYRYVETTLYTNNNAVGVSIINTRVMTFDMHATRISSIYIYHNWHTNMLILTHWRVEFTANAFLLLNTRELGCKVVYLFYWLLSFIVISLLLRECKVPPHTAAPQRTHMVSNCNILLRSDTM